ncbi:rhamnogalacturonan acetylesterase [Paenibacillus sp. WLX1005]|uniref:rhamnogalacturonan acetylesterase n=1 Tax=Paenibacillus sp. WLX1005 TaxID=3243766 RepID=UPI003983F541
MNRISYQPARRYMLLLVALVLLVGLWIAMEASADKRTPHAQPVVYIAGDSTVQTYTSDQQPQAGWGQMIGHYFDTGIVFSNHAISGRSTRTFIQQGRLDEIMNEIRPGDYLLIQFGHNDANTAKPDRYTPVNEYGRLLRDYVERARQNGATPVLITPMGTRDYNAQAGGFTISFPQYVEKMKQVAADTDTPLVDLSTSSVAYYNQLGEDATKKLFLYAEPGQYPAFPNGAQDNIHFQNKGADQMARLVAQGIQQLSIPLANHVQSATLHVDSTN